LLNFSPLFMTPLHHFSFLFPEEMDGLIYFPFVLTLFLSIQPSKNIKKTDI